jgi:hypothetical protein
MGARFAAHLDAGTSVNASFEPLVSVGIRTHRAGILGTGAGFRLQLIMHAIIRFITCIAKRAALDAAPLASRRLDRLNSAVPLIHNLGSC